MDFFTHAIKYATIEAKCALAILLVGIILIPIYYYFYNCREKKRIQMEKEEIAQITANIEKARRMLNLMRPNMFHRYEEKKAEGLAELDNWCGHYNMSIIEMEEFLGLRPKDNTNEILEQLQNIENGIYAPRISVPIGL